MFDPMGRQGGQMPMTSYAGNNALAGLAGNFGGGGWQGFANKQYPDGRLVSQPRPQDLPGGMKQPMQPKPYLPNTGGWTPPQIGGGASPYAPQLAPGMQPPMQPGTPPIEPMQTQSALSAYGEPAPLTIGPQGIPQAIGDWRQQMTDWRGMRPDRPDFQAMRGTEGFDPRQARQDWRGQIRDWRDTRPQFSGWR